MVDALKRTLDRGKSLKGVSLFKDLSPEAIRKIEAKCKWHRFAENEQIFSRGSPSAEVYFIVRGTVRVVIYSGPEQEIKLANFLEGEYFGEMAAIDESPRSADAFAQTDTLLASLDHKTFIGLLIKYPQLLQQINKRLVQIIRGLDVRVRDLTGLTPSQRVYMELLRLAGPAVKPDGTWGIRNMPNHKEIATWAGTIPATVARVIGHLARDGVVERHHKTLYINDYFRLRQLAQSVEESGATGSRAADA